MTVYCKINRVLLLIFFLGLLTGILIKGLGPEILWAVESAPPLRDSAPMIVIPEGDFVMGSAQGEGRADERPQRKISLAAFEIDVFEITNKQYLGFIKATGHKAPPNPYREGPLSEMEGIENLPVVQVTWYDAFDYCHWAGKRLPSEAEWEKAARGPNGNIFPWGKALPGPEQANFGIDWEDLKTLKAVGSFPKGESFYEVQDMAGNVREWVQDWYHPDTYQNAKQTNPAGPSDGILKVIRGGSWHHKGRGLRAAARDKGGFALKTDGIGFRCAKAIP